MSNNEQILKAILLEYDRLRQELLQTIKFQLNIYTYIFTGLSFFYGYIFLNKIYDAFIIIPFFTIVLAYRWIWDLQSSLTISQYIREVESIKIPEIIGELELEPNKHILWMGWQNFWYDTDNLRDRGWFYSAAMLLGLPTILSYIYYILVLISPDNIFGFLIDIKYLYPRVVYFISSFIYLFPCLHIVKIVFRMWYRGSEKIESTSRLYNGIKNILAHD